MIHTIFAIGCQKSSQDRALLSKSKLIKTINYRIKSAGWSLNKDDGSFLSVTVAFWFRAPQLLPDFPNFMKAFATGMSEHPKRPQISSLIFDITNEILDSVLLISLARADLAQPIHFKLADKNLSVKQRRY